MSWVRVFLHVVCPDEEGRSSPAAVLPRCKHPSLVLHTQTAMPGWTEMSAELPATQFHQHHHGIPTGFASWAGVCRLASSACYGVTPHLSLLLSRNHHTNVMITQNRALRSRLLEFDGDSEPGKTAANKHSSRICKAWGLGWSQNQKYNVPFGS